MSQNFRPRAFNTNYNLKQKISIYLRKLTPQMSAIKKTSCADIIWLSSRNEYFLAGVTTVCEVMSRLVNGRGRTDPKFDHSSFPF